ncbi:hypothetical protein WJX72_005012 [[Myrmecia] bisecta]|uniref:Protein kinase domain-containing protein n=1 Tax=[Myrmecia] bisecta TaxID=41462 RepID=A0AAW1PNU7_9CHLO
MPHMDVRLWDCEEIAELLSRVNVSEDTHVPSTKLVVDAQQFYSHRSTDTFFEDCHTSSGASLDFASQAQSGPWRSTDSSASHQLEFPLSPAKCLDTSGSTGSNSFDHLAGRLEAVELEDMIGRGAFGTVYRATWRGQPAAVKVIEHDEGFMPDSPQSDVLNSWTAPSSSAATPGASTSALLEAAMSSAVSHPSIVQTYDYQVLEPTPSGAHNGQQQKGRTHWETRIVMEYCDAGSLEEVIAEARFHLADGQAGGVDMEALCCTLLEIASALEYLHKMHIMHRDLKPKNVLLKSCAEDSRGFIAKISDFGLSRMLPEASPVGSMASTPDFTGTVTHMAPELLSEGRGSRAADVYSFGILMWEVLTGRTPYHHMSKVQIMVGVVSEDMRPAFPPACPPWYRDLASSCWVAEPKCRPNFAEICHAIRVQLARMEQEQHE